jgi:hypothetical protein
MLSLRCFGGAYCILNLYLVYRQVIYRPRLKFLSIRLPSGYIPSSVKDYIRPFIVRLYTTLGYNLYPSAYHQVIYRPRLQFISVRLLSGYILPSVTVSIRPLCNSFTLCMVTMSILPVCLCCADIVVFGIRDSWVIIITWTSQTQPGA